VPSTVGTTTLPATPRPRGAGPLQARIVDQGGGGPDPTVTIAGNAATVTLHLDAGVGAVVAKQIFLGWSNVPKESLPEHLRVRMRSLVVRSSTGPWSLFWDVAGIWGSWNGKGRQVVDIYVPRRRAWSFSATATGGVAGVSAARYSSPELGLGLQHALPAGSPAFQLDYVVTRVG
jgi:hypothetical protein